MNVDLKALAAPRDRLMVDGSVDPVTAEVIRGAMGTVSVEMAMYVSRMLEGLTLTVDETASEKQRADMRAARAA
ncbi:MAG TPA: hypothetical protein VNG12_16315 [Acidimicrobiales bacterium]|nr:hypothetical protein [Acidimicrobiales bacterium]